MRRSSAICKRLSNFIWKVCGRKGIPFRSRELCAGRFDYDKVPHRYSLNPACLRILLSVLGGQRVARFAGHGDECRLARVLVLPVTTFSSGQPSCSINLVTSRTFTPRVYLRSSRCGVLSIERHRRNPTEVHPTIGGERSALSKQLPPLLVRTVGQVRGLNHWFQLRDLSATNVHWFGRHEAEHQPVCSYWRHHVPKGIPGHRSSRCRLGHGSRVHPRAAANSYVPSASRYRSPACSSPASA